MSPNPFFSGRIPQELYDRAEEYVGQTGKSKTQVLVEALAAYLDFPVEIPGSFQGGVPRAEFEVLERRVKLLEDLLSNSSVISADNNDIQSAGDVVGIDNTVNQGDNSKSEEVEIGDRPVAGEQDRKPGDRSLQPLGGSQLNFLDSLSEIQPVSGNKLSAVRFGLNKDAVSGRKRKLSAEKFIQWTKEQDPDGIAWKFVEKPSKGYVPADELLSELESKLRKWIEEKIT